MLFSMDVYYYYTLNFTVGRINHRTLKNTRHLISEENFSSSIYRIVRPGLFHVTSRYGLVSSYSSAVRNLVFPNLKIKFDCIRSKPYKSISCRRSPFRVDTLKTFVRFKNNEHRVHRAGRRQRTVTPNKCCWRIVSNFRIEPFFKTRCLPFVGRQTKIYTEFVVVRLSRY